MNNTCSRIPSLIISILIALGFIIASVLDVQINYIAAFTASLITVCIAFITRLGIFKIVSTLLLGIWIYAYSHSLQVKPLHAIKKEMDAIVKGEVIAVQKTDSMRSILIVKGFVDGKFLPRMEPCRIVLHVRNSKGLNKTFSIGNVLSTSCTIHIPNTPVFPQAFNEYSYCISNNIQWIATANVQNTTILMHNRHMRTLGFEMNRSLKHAIESIFPHNSASIAQALLLGERSDLSFETKKAFSIAGTAHILSVSGYHAGIIVHILWIALAFVYNRHIKCILLASILLIFLFIINGDPPAIRACIMAFLIVLAKAYDREAETVHVLLCTALLMIVTDPPLVFSIGFQMSIAGMIGLIVLTPFFHQALTLTFKLNSHLHSIIIDVTSSSLAASCTMVPLTAWYFSIISLIAPLANLIIIPLLTAAMILILIALAFYPISFLLATMYAAPAHYLITGSEILHSWIAQVDSFTLNGVHTFILSLFLISLLIFNAFSKTRIQGLIRLSASCFFFTGVLAFTDVYNQYFVSQSFNYWTLYPREHIIVSILPKADSSINVIAQDRAIHQFPRVDYETLHFLLQDRHKSVTIFYQGNCSEKTANTIKRMRSGITRIIPITMKSVHRIMGIKGINHAQDKHAKNIVQIVKY